MQNYELQIRLTPTDSTRIVVRAQNGSTAMLMGEAMYGKGSVVSYSPISDQEIGQYRY